MCVNQTFGRSFFDQPEKIAQIRAIVDSEAEKLRQRISASPDGSIDIDLQDEFSGVALRVALAVIFGKHDVPKETIAELHVATRTILKGFPLEAASPFAIPHWLLSYFSPHHAAVERGERFLRSFAEDLLKAEEQRPSDPPTALTRMVEALNRKSPLLDRDTVLNNIRVLLIAGHETSGNILAYAIASLALRPESATAVVREASQPRWRELKTLTDLREQLPFIRQVIEESLRLHPPFYVLLRRTTSDITAECPTGKKFLIPKDTEVTLDIFSAQRDESFWGEQKTGYPADRFVPERWSAQNISERNISTQDLDLFSFGLGSRICLGLHMFWAEALPFVATLMGEFTFSPAFEDTEVGMNGDLSLQREGGYPTRVSLRK
jgi:cytochrome P450